MSDAQPTFDEFRAELERLFAQPLTEPAEAAAKDFWENWSSFTAAISNRSLAVHADALRLGMQFPEYKRYHVWKGAGTVAVLVGLVAVWFFWPAGVAFIIGGIALHIWGGRVKYRAASNFAENLMKEATLNPGEGGYAGLCSHYIAGTIQLASSQGVAHWPQYPSNVLTGTKSFIDT